MKYNDTLENSNKLGQYIEAIPASVPCTEKYMPYKVNWEPIIVISSN
ncbi:hypothetical protein [Clostridium ljungdahlii]|nr:hypothetical protein [Clostridium ljungdahlii]